MMEAQYFFDLIEKLSKERDLTDRQLVERQLDLLVKFFAQVSQKEKLHFSTLFSRFAFVMGREQVPQEVQSRMQWFRRRASLVVYEGKPASETDALCGWVVLGEAVSEILHQPLPESLRALRPEKDPFPPVVDDMADHIPYVRAFVSRIDEVEKMLVARDRDRPGREILVKYGHHALNEGFDPTVSALKSRLRGRATVNLLDVQVDKTGVYYPGYIVLEPDFLMDVSAIAKCFRENKQEPEAHLLSKFLSADFSEPLLLGNVANLFLDELMNDPGADFISVFKKSFWGNPIQFCLLSDDQVNAMRDKAQKHFATIRELVMQRFGERRIDPAHCYLEPSFFSEKYGIQGRLDVLFREPGPQGRSAIIELKSGLNRFANRYGVTPDHFVQTLLYDLLLRSVFGEAIGPETFVLYSKLELDALKFVPQIKSQQQDAINLRNLLVVGEWSLCRIDEGDLSEKCLFDLWNNGRLHERSLFTRRDLDAFSKVWINASALERKYFRAFVAFTAREHRLARIGVEGSEQLNGQASLWLDPLEWKAAHFDALAYLKIRSHSVADESPTVELVLTERSARLTNFRSGDIAVLYPFVEGKGPLDTQVFKCNIVAIDPEKVVVRLRSKQFNRQVFDDPGCFWALEQDSMDSSFNAQYRGLFSFLQEKKEKKELLLGARPPKLPLPNREDRNWPGSLTEEQIRILDKALDAREYFLLLGPPGTGKTQFMLHHYAKHLLEHTDQNLLLLAYTNRAVDEICESIAPFARDRFVRLGSDGSSGGAWGDVLWKNRVEELGSRAKVKEYLDSRRIVVSTVSSLNGHLDLLKLKHFDRVVLDEASQVLEPQLVGLLGRFERFLLIGDHKQLPAVVLQEKSDTELDDPDLVALGLRDRRNSLFERLYRLAEQNGWSWAYDMLSVQGRMHRDIAAYPGMRFYAGNLKTLPESVDTLQWQSAPLERTAAGDEALARGIAAHRFLFVDTPADTAETLKTNRYEAEIVVRAVENFRRIYEAREDWSLSKIGVIAPYRAQIACIREALAQAGPEYEAITVDTVERYQGGARDIILVSFCANAPHQLDTLVSLGDDGVVDRKLNVALTRARQHLVLIGNRKTLEIHPVYRDLLDFVPC